MSIGFVSSCNLFYINVWISTNEECLDSGPEEYKDAPTTLQLIGQIQEDEKLAAIAIVIDKVLNH